MGNDGMGILREKLDYYELRVQEIANTAYRRAFRPAAQNLLASTDDLVLVMAHDDINLFTLFLVDEMASIGSASKTFTDDTIYIVIKSGELWVTRWRNIYLFFDPLTGVIDSESILGKSARIDTTKFEVGLLGVLLERLEKEEYITAGGMLNEFVESESQRLRL